MSNNHTKDISATESIYFLKEYVLLNPLKACFGVPLLPVGLKRGDVIALFELLRRE